MVDLILIHRPNRQQIATESHQSLRRVAEEDSSTIGTIASVRHGPGKFLAVPGVKFVVAKFTMAELPY